MPPRYQAAAHRFLARITPSAVNGAGPAHDRGHRLPEGRPLSPDLAAARDHIDRADAAHADEREARIRESEQISRSLPEGSYGRRNLEP
jgi:hypothetical protein